MILLNGAVGNGIFSESVGIADIRIRIAVYKVARSLQCFSDGNGGNTGCS